MKQMADLAERPRLDRVDHHSHSLMQRLRDMDRLGRAVAALGAVLGGAILGRIGDTTRKERLAPPAEILRIGKVGEGRDRGIVQMCLGKIEADVRHATDQRLQPRVGVSRD